MCRFAVMIPLLLVVDGISQDKQLRKLLPVDYSAEGLLDVDKARESELWEGVVRSPFLAPALKAFKDKLGFDLDDLRRVRLALPDPKEVEGVVSRGLVVTFEGKDSVGLPKFVKDSRWWRSVKIGAADVRQFSVPSMTTPGDIYYSPKEGQLVYGTDAALAPGLRGERLGGVPVAGLMRMTAARGSLMHFALRVDPADLRTPLWKRLAPVLPGDWWQEKDPPRWFLIRLRQESDEERVVFEAVVRFETGASGPAALAAVVKKQLAVAAKHRRLGAMKRIWRKVEVAIDDDEPMLTIKLDLGRPRNAGGTLAQVVGPLALLAIE